MKIGVDLDNVLFNWQPFWADLYHEWFGVRIPKAKLTEWTSAVDLTHFETMHEFLEWFARADGWTKMPYIPGGPGAVDQMLADGHHVTFVTSRSGSAEEPTRRWFQSSPWAKNRNVQLITGAGLKTGTPCSVYIDDSPAVLEALIGIEKPVIVFDAPWNRQVQARRAKNWAEALELLKEIES